MGKRQVREHRPSRYLYGCFRVERSSAYACLDLSVHSRNTYPMASQGAYLSIMLMSSVCRRRRDRGLGVSTAIF